MKTEHPFERLNTIEKAEYIKQYGLPPHLINYPMVDISHKIATDILDRVYTHISLWARPLSHKDYRWKHDKKYRLLWDALIGCIVDIETLQDKIKGK